MEAISLTVNEICILYLEIPVPSSDINSSADSLRHGTAQIQERKFSPCYY